MPINKEMLKYIWSMFTKEYETTLWAYIQNNIQGYLKRKARRRTVCLACNWLYNNNNNNNNNKQQNINLNLQKAIQETGKRACVLEWNLAVKDESGRFMSHAGSVLYLLNFVLYECITQ